MYHLEYLYYVSSRSKFASPSRQSQQQQQQQRQQQQKPQRPPYKVPYRPPPPKVIPRQPPIKTAPASCVDNKSVTFNLKSCSDIGTNLDFMYYCKNCQVQKVCCKSCWQHRNKYKCWAIKKRFPLFIFPSRPIQISWYIFQSVMHERWDLCNLVIQNQICWKVVHIRNGHWKLI